MIDQREDSDPEYPLVFQCAKCNAILGDSLSWLCAIEDLGTITLSHVTSKVEVPKKLVTSTEGCDLGSTYSALKCVGCGAMVGKLYKTTPKPLDALRDFFTLFVSKLDSYQLGSADKHTVGSTGHSGPAQLVCQLPQSSGVLVEIRKIQVVILELSQRLEALEGTQSAKNEEEFAGDIPIQISAPKEHVASEHSDDDEYVYGNDRSKLRSRQEHDLELSIMKRRSPEYRDRSRIPNTKRKRLK